MQNPYIYLMMHIHDKSIFSRTSPLQGPSCRGSPGQSGGALCHASAPPHGCHQCWLSPLGWCAGCCPRHQPARGRAAASRRQRDQQQALIESQYQADVASCVCGWESRQESHPGGHEQKVRERLETPAVCVLTCSLAPAQITRNALTRNFSLILIKPKAGCSALTAAHQEHFGL